MQYVLVECPYVLVPILVVVAYVCLVVWLRRRTVRAKRVLLVALLLCVVLPIVQKLVVTEREQVYGVCAALTNAVENHDIDAFSQYVSARFQTGEWDRDRLLDEAERAFERYGVTSPKLRVPRTEINGNRAVVDLNVTVTLTEGGFTGRRPTTWTAVFVKEGDGWRLVGVDPRRTAFFPWEHLEQISR